MYNDNGSLAEVEKIIGYVFKDRSHLRTALTHKSYVNEKLVGHAESYEKYEFLGDAILEYISSEFLFEEYKELSEGELTKLRASLVCEFTLSKIVRALKLGQYVLFSKGEKNTGGADRDSILCDIFESILGAVYLDGGIEPARVYVKTHLLTDIENKRRFHDSKTMIQEYAQSKGLDISYVTVGESGPDHMKTFEVELKLGGETVGRGRGGSKKNAEQEAAYEALNMIKDEE